MSRRKSGGFPDGAHGRGATPYSRSHSSKPSGHSAEAHSGTSGRGAPGVISGPVGHPQTHAEFESLGCGGK